MALLQTFFEIFWLFLPVGVANSAPTIAAHYNWFSVLARPIDGGAYFGKYRVFGDHKTIRGLLLGVLFGALAACFQYYLQTIPSIVAIVIFPLVSLNQAVLFGGALGFGALAGDAIKSFFKRRVHVVPGQPWRPFDQIDSIIGGLIAGLFFVPISLTHILVAIISFGLIVFIVSSVGVFFHIKKTI